MPLDNRERGTGKAGSPSWRVFYAYTLGLIFFSMQEIISLNFAFRKPKFHVSYIAALPREPGPKVTLTSLGHTNNAYKISVPSRATSEENVKIRMETYKVLGSDKL